MHDAIRQGRKLFSDHNFLFEDNALGIFQKISAGSKINYFRFMTILLIQCHRTNDLTAYGDHLKCDVVI